MLKTSILIVTGLLLAACASPVATDRLENASAQPVPTTGLKTPDGAPTASADRSASTRAPKPTTESDYARGQGGRKIEPTWPPAPPATPEHVERWSSLSSDGKWIAQGVAEFPTNNENYHTQLKVVRTDGSVE